MPTYEYKCLKCGEEFERTMTLGEHEKGERPTCPKCQSQDVEQLVASFQPVTSKKY